MQILFGGLRIYVLKYMNKVLGRNIKSGFPMIKYPHCFSDPGKGENNPKQSGLSKPKKKSINLTQQSIFTGKRISKQAILTPRGASNSHPTFHGSYVLITVRSCHAEVVPSVPGKRHSSTAIRSCLEIKAMRSFYLIW